jgi:hypothetical protein
MAVISNLGIPDRGNVTSTIMPKLAYRFRVTFISPQESGFTNTITRSVIGASRPTLQHDPITLDSYNSRIYLAGKHTWAPIQITFRDDVDSAVMKQVNSQMNLQVDHANQSSPRAGSSYKFGLLVETLDGANPSPGVLDTYELAGCFITNVSYGDLNYGQSDQITMSITVQYDNAEIYDAAGQATLTGAKISQSGAQASGAGSA